MCYLNENQLFFNDYYDDEDKTIKLQNIYTSFSGICADLLLPPFIPYS